MGNHASSPWFLKAGPQPQPSQGIHLRLLHSDPALQGAAEILQDNSWGRGLDLKSMLLPPPHLQAFI